MFISLWRLSTRWAPAAHREWLLYVRPFRNKKREKKEKHKIQFIEFEKAGLHSPAEATNFCWPNCDHHGSTTITTNTMSKWWLWQRPALAAVVSSGGWCKAGGMAYSGECILENHCQNARRRRCQSRSMWLGLCSVVFRLSKEHFFFSIICVDLSRSSIGIGPVGWFWMVCDCKQQYESYFMVSFFSVS